MDQRLDMIAGIQHDSQADADYALLRSVNIATARDGVRWHLIETEPGRYDWSSFLPMLEAAHRQNVQIIWDLCHYGWPDGLDLLSAAFPDRFARFAEAVALQVRAQSEEVPFYSPINEISFFAWAAARGLMFPHAEGRDQDIKLQLVRSTIAAVEAIRSVDPRARFIYPEPTIHVLPQPGHPDSNELANRYTRSQFEAWDMIAGYESPDLGGKPAYLDILGSNFYGTNEWTVLDGQRLLWYEQPRDARWRPFSLLLGDIWARYRLPLFVAETSDVGAGRAPWITDIGNEVLLARANGIPIEGICLYPVIDRYDWGNPEHWHHSGLWDLEKTASGELCRVLNQPYSDVLLSLQASFAQIGCR